MITAQDIFEVTAFTLVFIFGLYVTYHHIKKSADDTTLKAIACGLFIPPTIFAFIFLIIRISEIGG